MGSTIIFTFFVHLSLFHVNTYYCVCTVRGNSTIFVSDTWSLRFDTFHNTVLLCVNASPILPVTFETCHRFCDSGFITPVLLKYTMSICTYKSVNLPQSSTVPEGCDRPTHSRLSRTHTLSSIWINHFPICTSVQIQLSIFRCSLIHANVVLCTTF